MSVKISELTETSSLSNSAVFPVVDDNETKKITYQNLNKLVNRNVGYGTSLPSASNYSAGDIFIVYEA